MSSSFKDFFELDANMSLIEMFPKKEWIGKTLDKLQLRKLHNINVVAIREEGKLWGFVDPAVPFNEKSILLIAVEEKDMNKCQ